MRNQNSPIIVAALDLTDEKQRQLQDIIRRTHTGRWRSYRAIAMSQADTGIIEIAEMVPRRRTQPREFVVLHWAHSPLALFWQSHATRGAAMTAFNRAVKEKVLRGSGCWGTNSTQPETHHENQTAKQPRGRTRSRIAG